MSLPSSSHIVKQFDEDLAVLRDLVLRMGGLVETQLAAAIEALERGDGAAAASVIRGDREIDRIELESDAEVARLLALRAPLGIDLRTVLTLGKTVNDLERIGDEAKKIARSTRNSAAQGRELGGVPTLAGVLDMAGLARSMLRDALNALVRLDLELAVKVAESDDLQDQALKEAIAQGKALMQSRPELVNAAFDLVFMAKSLERIADHAKNIANYVHYLVEGEDVRHPAARRDRD